LYSPSVVIFFLHETICFLFYVLTYFVRNCLALNPVQNAQALNCSVTEDDREKSPCWWKQDLFLKVVITYANQLNTNFTYIAVFEKKKKGGFIREEVHYWQGALTFWNKAYITLAIFTQVFYCVYATQNYSPIIHSDCVVSESSSETGFEEDFLSRS